MKIITLTNPGLQTEFERDYIYDFLLKDVSTIDATQRVLVFSSNLRGVHPDSILPADVLVHLSNENLKYNYNFLKKSNVVLRSYYHPFVWHPRCYAIPLGWKTGLANKYHEIGNHDKYMWSFIGQIKGYRKPMYETFQSLTPGFCSVSPQWNSMKLTDREVQQIYLGTAFAPVPFGSIHADTIRVMEVLEWGCIPVMVKYMHEDYYKYIYGNHPFIVCRNWEEARRIVENLWSDKAALRKKQEDVKSWYEDFKVRLCADVHDIVAGKQPSRCEQWKYQKEGRLNVRMLLSWYYHFYFKKRPIY